MKRKQSTFVAGFALAALSVLFQVAGFTAHVVLDDHGACEDGCASAAAPISGPLALHVQAADAINSSEAQDCLVCEALQQLRPETDVLALPALGEASLTTVEVALPELGSIRSTSVRTHLSRGPPSLLT